MCDDREGALAVGAQQRMDAVAVRRRLTLCVFLFTISTSVMAQVYPKASMCFFLEAITLLFKNQYKFISSSIRDFRLSFSDDVVAGPQRRRQRPTRASKQHAAYRCTARAAGGRHVTCSERHPPRDQPA